MIPFTIRPFEDLGLPKIVQELADRPKGLVLVTGPTGSGKSTTLAAMIDKINSERSEHIMTVETRSSDCIRTRRAREPARGALERDSSRTLRAVLIRTGSLRRRDARTGTIAAAIRRRDRALTFGPDTNSCAQDINGSSWVTTTHRARSGQLSLVLEGVLSQTLIRSRRGRVMALGHGRDPRTSGTSAEEKVTDILLSSRGDARDADDNRAGRSRATEPITRTTRSTDPAPPTSSSSCSATTARRAPPPRRSGGVKTPP